MVSIPVRSRTGTVGEFNSYGWELVYIGSLTVSKKSLFYGFDISKYIDIKDLLTFGIKGVLLVFVFSHYKNK